MAGRFAGTWRLRASERRLALHGRLARAPSSCFTAAVALPYKISTLLYCFNERDEVLLLERRKEPNRGLWSPCGGKLKMETGESPYTCACREAEEEIGLRILPTDLHLTGIVTEHGYEGQSHWLMFLFELTEKLAKLPPPHDEGRFSFFSRDALKGLALPQTDREQIWPLFWRHRGGFFAAHCHCHPDGRNDWKLEESTQPSTINHQPSGNARRTDH
ncbi:MAG: NUDIX hydrolase [Verrucomicrobia bacterium]|nr:MAG: NUDIX hydrolase [Verrucomicrobiota bacterium]